MSLVILIGLVELLGTASILVPLLLVSLQARQARNALGQGLASNGCSVLASVDELGHPVLLISVLGLAEHRCKAT